MLQLLNGSSGESETGLGKTQYGHSEEGNCIALPISLFNVYCFKSLKGQLYVG